MERKNLKTEESSQEQRGDRKEVVEPKEGLLYTYSNYCTADWTSHDIRIRFSEMAQMPGYRVPEDARTLTRIEERVSVAMSWSQAKALRDLLTGIIESVEATHGEIKEPPNA